MDVRLHALRSDDVERRVQRCVEADVSLHLAYRVLTSLAPGRSLVLKLLVETRAIEHSNINVFAVFPLHHELHRPPAELTARFMSPVVARDCRKGRPPKQLHANIGHGTQTRQKRQSCPMRCDCKATLLRCAKSSMWSEEERGISVVVSRRVLLGAFGDLAKVYEECHNRRSFLCWLRMGAWTCQMLTCSPAVLYTGCQRRGYTS